MVPLKNIPRFLTKLFKQPSYALHVGIRRLRAYASYNKKSGRAPLPEAVTFFLTHRCNLRCKMCGQWGTHGITKTIPGNLADTEMSFDVYKRIIDRLAEYRPGITLFGGEPFMYNGCLDIIQYIKKKNMHCLVITNGSLLAMHAREIVGSGLDELNLSLDGPEALHDEIRGLPGLFRQITGGVKEIARIKKEQKTKCPLINLQCTISRYNYRILPELIAVAREIEADSLTFHNLIFLEPQRIKEQEKYDKLLDASSRDWQGFVFGPEIDVDVLYEKMREIKSKKYAFAVDFYPNFSLSGLKNYYSTQYLPREYAPRCLSPWITAYIFPDGTLRPCLNSTYSFGNVKNADFAQIWNSDAACRFRKTLREHKMFPACLRCTELYRY